MPEEQAAEAVSDATESTDEQSDDSSSADTQAAAEQRERLSLRRLLREDPDVNAEFQREIARAKRRWERANLRGAASQAVQAGDKDAALQVAATIANTGDDDDDEDSATDPAWLEKRAKVAPFLDRLLRVDAAGQSHNPYYVKVFQKVGQAEIDRRYAEDPEQFYDWIDDQIQDARAEDKARKIAPSLADAVATDKANQQLRRMPSALSGGAGAGAGLSVEMYERMSAEDRQKIRRENPQLIDAMTARLG